jgi:hypothetical protein
MFISQISTGDGGCQFRYDVMDKLALSGEMTG